MIQSEPQTGFPLPFRAGLRNPLVLNLKYRLWCLIAAQGQEKFRVESYSVGTVLASADFGNAHSCLLGGVDHAGQSCQAPGGKEGEQMVRWG